MKLLALGIPFFKGMPVMKLGKLSLSEWWQGWHMWCVVVYDVLSPEMDSLYFSDRTCCISPIRLAVFFWSGNSMMMGKQLWMKALQWSCLLPQGGNSWWPRESMPLYIAGVEDTGKNYWVQVRERARGRVLIGRNVDATPGVWPSL